MILLSTPKAPNPHFDVLSLEAPMLHLPVPSFCVPRIDPPLPEAALEIKPACFRPNKNNTNTNLQTDTNAETDTTI